MTIATFYLGGESLQWFQWLYATHQVTDCHRFSQDGLSRFAPSAYSNAEVLLQQLHQTRSVADYISKFESLSIRTPGFPPTNLLNRFIVGLKPEVHNELGITLPKAMGMARLAEQKLRIDCCNSWRPSGVGP
ncbi:hypothetical protein QQ045_007512 [Rhodiola kirilowii]